MLFLTLLLGCLEVRTAGDPFGDDGSAGAATTGAELPGGTGDSSGSEGESTSDGSQLFDVAPGADGAGDSASGCSKVDFLFVIDNSASMKPNQDALVAAFPGFIDTIQAQLDTDDFHVMVVDSDEDPTIACEAGWVACDDPYVCEGYSCGDNVLLGPCDRALGGAVATPRGGSTVNGSCGLDADRRFLTGSDPDLHETFACIAKVGVSGDWDERPLGAMVAAVSPDMTAADGCNEGFLRDDGILVVTVLTTGDPNTSTEARGSDAQAWYDALVQAKGGNADSIVMLTITTPYSVIIGLGSTGSEAYDDFTAMFGDRGRTADLATPTYVDFFADSVSVIDEVCDDFVPAG